VPVTAHFLSLITECAVATLSTLNVTAPVLAPIVEDAVAAVELLLVLTGFQAVSLVTACAALSSASNRVLIAR
jgi:hypothetical protein